ncbi:fumarylacetoacetase [Leucothrix arctica]|uniref:fumarylacetoacetase n=1 Tax=Leucothrix arctica TaxID=1481894 RepID=A0A317CBB2_9GAMM|nr:fumarylacetoacetase [Leucothrix arctica]PWQ94603.1 fumarylacetoacetase [Leucothrix arctica]
MIMLNETHDPSLQSWVASANESGTDFSIQNLPFAAFRRQGTDEAFRGGVAIGDQIVDLAALQTTGLYDGLAGKALDAAAESRLNRFMDMGKETWSALRLALSRSLREGASEQSQLETCLVAQADAEYALPAQIGDYTDFYASIHHARNIGSLFRPDNPLLPNYQWVPIGYHGRSSSLDVSGADFPRPCGQIKAPDADIPVYAASKRLDYELEVGIYIGKGNKQGQAITIDKAEDHVFGLCVLNDWSARDMQAWEYQPLGPFLAKNFASTLSPWIITTEALAPFRTNWTRPEEDPQPLDYLDSDQNRQQGGFDLKLEVLIETKKMRNEGTAPISIGLTNFDYSYWTVAQMVAHHTVNGCNLRAGDLLGSGTMSGPDTGQEGALIERTRGGKEPVDLGNGEMRTFLEDGDKVIMRAWCEQDGKRRIGLGSVESTVLPKL